MDSRASPKVSFVIPVHDVAARLGEAVPALLGEAAASGRSCEWILAENGSRDRTVTIAEELVRTHDGVRLVTVSHRNYGAALRLGILMARGELLVCAELGAQPAHFHERALELLSRTNVDLVIGSPLLAGSTDGRPMVRRVTSRLYTWFLRRLFGYRGADTRGLKVFRRRTLLPLVKQCITDQDVFTSELAIRAYRAGLDVREMPVRHAKPCPSPGNMLRRLPHVMLNLFKLTWAIRFARAPSERPSA